MLTVTHLLLILMALSPQSDWKRVQCTGEFISGRYVNYAVGYSVEIPTGWKGKRGQASGPERGFSIPLSTNCSGVIAFEGKPNSLEWANAHIAAVKTASYYDNTVVLRRYRTKLGRLPAVGMVIRYRDTLEIDEFVVALRPGGALVYTAQLGTTKSRYRQDHRRFVEMLGRFRLEPWR